MGIPDGVTIRALQARLELMKAKQAKAQHEVARYLRTIEGLEAALKALQGEK